MSTRQRIGTLILCILITTSDSLGARPPSAAPAPEPPRACLGTAAWPDATVVIDLTEGLCFALQLAGTPEYAMCWRPLAPAQIADRLSGCTRLSFRALAPLKRQGAARACPVPCLYVALSHITLSPSITIALYRSTRTQADRWQARAEGAEADNMPGHVALRLCT